MKKQSFFKGTIVGAMIGAVAGVLLAPKSGKETQDDIKRTVKNIHRDTQAKLQMLSDEMTGRVENLKEAAKDLKGEAKEESQELIRRAEILKQDLRISASTLAQNGAEIKDSAMKDVKNLFNEGQDVLSELERVTKHLASSAKTKVQDQKSPAADDKKSED